ncbi:hypothetical protein [Pseudomonas sp. DWP3-1-2]|uniref:hypothetical protein n=1 Tax=Pseudomonas sp. DWP3-1-2 TaxID=2804645 RepID=UPI003CECFF80
MRKLLSTVFAVLFMSTPVWAATCSFSPPNSKFLNYEPGKGLPVITGPYQFNLTEKPKALLAFDGVMAVYPNKEYISYQLISDEIIAETLSQFTTRVLSAADLDRYLYGVFRLDELNDADQKLIVAMRADLKLECQVQITHYHIGSEVEALLHEGAGSEHRILVLSEKSTHLISVKGTQTKALEVLQSIKKRSL